MKITERQLRRVIRERLKSRTMDTKWWKNALWGVVEDTAGYGTLDPETSRNILTALEELTRELKDDLRGDIR
mgnify:CR=1 FL=1